MIAWIRSWSLWCLITGEHKWTSISKKERTPAMGLDHIPGKRCTRCGLTKPVKSRQQKRDDTTKELTAKAVMREPVKE